MTMERRDIEDYPQLMLDLSNPEVRNHFAAFEIAIMARNTLPEADQHIRYVCAVYSAVFPFSPITAEKCKLLENPKLHSNYLVHP